MLTGDDGMITLHSSKALTLSGSSQVTNSFSFSKMVGRRHSDEDKTTGDKADQVQQEIKHKNVVKAINEIHVFEA